MVEARMLRTEKSAAAGSESFCCEKFALIPGLGSFAGKAGMQRPCRTLCQVIESEVERPGRNRLPAT